ncbi:hypothetical protein [Epiphyas postvittana nucleopolyhedrovirus]|uniref:Uncharacterized protein n=1 Tax=Epiphyas postvittana nucleopolyhedrovirus TaxID=70600 RepID=Q91GK8_NPVEP|nr:hypothetical protein [Epiphyas postvittana nucleopolyhedrovirus]AAK85607.1 unknown [Epiphyas postvittana nucleopolyhedrovirus]
MDEKKIYCCAKQCIDATKWSMADGIACDICRAFSFCHCKCLTHMKNLPITRKLYLLWRKFIK